AQRGPRFWQKLPVVGARQTPIPRRNVQPDQHTAIRKSIHNGGRSGFRKNLQSRAWSIAKKHPDGAPAGILVVRRAPLADYHLASVPCSRSFLRELNAALGRLRRVVALRGLAEHRRCRTAPDPNE